MTNIYDFTCPQGGRFYTCGDPFVEFFGCCNSSPCNSDHGGICDASDLRPTTFPPLNYKAIPPYGCYGHGNDTSDWYVCADTRTPFVGCCASDPCQADGCPDGDLIMAKSRNSPDDPGGSSSSLLQTSTTVLTATVQTVSTTSKPQSSSTGPATNTAGAAGGNPVSTVTISGTGSVVTVVLPPSAPAAAAESRHQDSPPPVGAIVGGVVGGVLVLVAVLMLMWWKRRRDHQRQFQQNNEVTTNARSGYPPSPVYPFSPYKGRNHLLFLSSPFPSVVSWDTYPFAKVFLDRFWLTRPVSCQLDSIVRSPTMRGEPEKTINPSGAIYEADSTVAASPSPPSSAVWSFSNRDSSQYAEPLHIGPSDSVRESARRIRPISELPGSEVVRDGAQSPQLRVVNQ